jgi:ATP synthase protein I
MPPKRRYLSCFQSIRIVLRIIDLAGRCQYGPRGFKGAGEPRAPQAASVESMSDDAREHGDDRGIAHTDEAALSARLQRLGEGLARQRADQPSAGPDENRATTASGYARGFRLSSELVAGVVVGAGLGWLIDRWLGIAPWGLIVFLLLGFAAGVLNVMRSAGVMPDRGSPERPR